MAVDEEGREFVDIDCINADTPLAALMLDSLATVELMYGIEQAFGIHVSEDEAFEFQTVGDAMRYIREQVAIRATRVAPQV